MEPRFEKTSNQLIIEWMEKKQKNESPTHHYYNKKPVKLQMHPKKELKLIRAHFTGAMPAWIKRYAEDHNFEVKQVHHEGKDGWWIAKWGGFEENPLSSPTIKGAVRQFSKMIPFVCEDLREKVMDNLDVIERNLHIDPYSFQKFGLYYRPEQMKNDGGCLLLESDVIPEREEENDEDYRNKVEAVGKLSELVWEITTPLPEPEVPEQSEEELLDELELVDAESEEDFSLGEIVIELEDEPIDIPELEGELEIPILKNEEELEEISLEGIIVLDEEESEDIPLVDVPIIDGEEVEEDFNIELEDIEENTEDEMPLSVLEGEMVEETLTNEQITDANDSCDTQLLSSEEQCNEENHLVEEIKEDPIEENVSETKESTVDEKVEQPNEESFNGFLEQEVETVQITVLKEDDKKAKARAGQVALF